MINKRGQTKITIVIIIAVTLIIASGISGYFVGVKSTTTKYEDALNIIAPEPPAEIFHVEGVVQEISGDSFKVEIPKIKRYIPGEDAEFINITVNTNAGTTLVSKTDFFSENATATNIEYSNIAVGDYVGIDSDTNIKNANSVDATKVTKLVETPEPPHD